MKKQNKNFLFITGMARSGTTLLDKILGSHSKLGVLSQPFPHLFRHIKKTFFNEIGHPEKYYVLNNLFKEEFYTRQDFIRFLDSYRFDIGIIKILFEEMNNWSGQLTKVTNTSKLTTGFQQSSLGDTFKFLLDKLNYNQNALLLGAKEILAEEFIPYFLANNIKVILVIRDPRDVYTSLNFGRGTDYGGSHRPTLFHLRNWRKSIAVANTFQDHPNFLTIKYEDLLLDQVSALDKITGFLEVEAFTEDRFSREIPTQSGERWLGNSSTMATTGINTNNSKKYLRYLNSETIRYIEYICGPEMNLYGYIENFSHVKRNHCPTEFSEPFSISINNLHKDMSSDSKYLKEEAQRRNLLENGTENKDQIISYFYSVENFQKLKNCSGEF